MKFLALFFLIGAVVCIDNQYADHDIEQLCESGPSLECLRDVLAERGIGESVTDGSGQASYTETYVPYVLPSIPLDVVLTDFQFSNMADTTVEDAFYDKTNNRYFFSVRFHKVVCDAQKSLIIFRRSLQEPLVIETDIHAEYPNVLVTAYIQANSDGSIDSENFRQGAFNAHFTDNIVPTFVFGDEITSSQDPLVLQTLGKLTEDPETACEEIFVSKAGSVLSAYLDNLVFKFAGIAPDFQYSVDPTVIYNVLNGGENPSISRPCEGSDDVRACVAAYHLDNGAGASEVGDINDDPVSRPGSFVQGIPFLQMTAETIGADLSVEGDIVEFYINENTNNLVTCVEHPGIVMKSSNVIISLAQPDAQPKTYEETNRDVYPGTSCLVTPLNNGLSADALAISYVFFDFGDNVPTFESTQAPELAEDPDVQEVNEAFEQKPVLSGQEIMRSEARPLFIAFLQKYVANYGLELTNELSY